MKNCINFKQEELKIQQLNRLNEDACYKKLNNKTISKIGKYQTRSFKDCVCEAPTVQEVALQHPSFYYKDSYVSIDGHYVEHS